MTLRAADIAAALGTPPPTAEQVAVIEASTRPTLVVAGAGSGKTETMAGRVVWLVANGLVAPDEVLGLTFTRKAASELSERIARRLRGLRAAGLWHPPVDDGTGAEVLGGTATVSTYHAYAGRIVREHGLRLGVEPQARLLTEAAAWQLAAEVVGRYDGPMADVEWAESTVTAALVDLAGELAEHLRTPAELSSELTATVRALAAVPAGAGRRQKHPLREVMSTLRARQALVPMLQAYAEVKAGRDCLDFADQMALAARLASGVPLVGRGERRRYRAVLLDEFQDTSEAQLVLLRSLFAASEDGAISVTAVGDPHQSIYGWRGASATTLGRFPREFADRAGPAQVLPLRTSWRNDAAILAVANVVAGPLRAGAAVQVAALAARPGAGPGQAHAARYDTVEDEARGVAGWIAQRWASPSGRRTGASAAVICRKRSQFALVVEALQEAGLPVEVVGLGGLLLTAEVADLMALLWVVHDPTRGDHLARLLTGPPVFLGAADLDGLAAWARELERRAAQAADDPASPAPRRVDPEAGMALADALDDLPPYGWRSATGQQVSATARSRLAAFAALVRRLRRLTGLALPDLVGEAERALHLDVEVAVRPEHTPSSARAHLDAFTDAAVTFSASADRPTLGGFLAWLAAAVEHERGLEAPAIETSRDAVQVLTVHAAKGLEWDVVAIPGLVEGGFPAWAHPPRVTWRADRWAVDAPRDGGWTVGASGVPYRLRGDADGLPVLRHDAPDWSELAAAYEDFRSAGGAHEAAEERRLLYVAVTRARREALLTAAVWGDPKAPRVTSGMLEELVSSGVVDVDRWAPMPDGSTGMPDNPRLLAAVATRWPPAHPGTERSGEALAAAAVSARLDDPGPATSAGSGMPADPRWDRVALLLDAEERTRGAARTATLPSHLSASALVSLADDPVRFARRLRRPMPAPAAIAARRGTAFHAWVEGHFGAGALLDLDEFPGSSDEPAESAADLGRMQDLFLASSWADQRPIAVETAVEMVLAGVAVRGRIDAVFPRADGGVTLVDWKTGPRPTGRAADVAALQLGMYAAAYASLHDVPAEQVGAAFYYAATGTTVPVRVPSVAQIEGLLADIPVLDDGPTARET